MLECWPFSGSDSIYFNQKSASRLRHELSSGTRYWSSSTLCALCTHAVHCATVNCVLCSVQCVVSAVLCCALHSGGKHPFSPICVALFGRLPVWPNDKRYKMPAKEKNTDTKEHFKSSLWSDSLGWHARPICKNSHNVQHQISRYFAYICVCVYIYVIGTHGDLNMLYKVSF